MRAENNDEDLISIIVPVYNTEKYLEQCLKSLLNQTYKNIEIIVVNDGSTDQSLDILNKYSFKDNRIKLYSQKNQGISAARNTALEHINGKYIMSKTSMDSVIESSSPQDSNGYNIFLNIRNVLTREVFIIMEESEG